MTEWSDDELNRIGAAEELQISSRRADGTLSSSRTIWVVRRDNKLFVRSMNGITSAWFRGTRARHAGHVRAGGVDVDVRLTDVGHELDQAIDSAYYEKYGDQYPQFMDAMTSEQAQSATMRLDPE